MISKNSSKVRSRYLGQRLVSAKGQCLSSAVVRASVWRMGVAMLGGTILTGLGQAAVAQARDLPMVGSQPGSTAASPGTVSSAPPAVVAQPVTIHSIVVDGAVRLEPDTVLSYISMRVGQPWTNAAADQALKDLYGTELFSDVQINNNDGNVVIRVQENPVINRIVFEGNKHIKDDKITPEIKLAAREIFTRSKVRADVQRIIELYKREGRFGASVDPKMVKLDQNRVDVIFEINEGPKSKVREINILGAHAFTVDQLRHVMMTHQARPLHLFTSGTSYDPDKMEYDQQKLRQFYLTQGYADFHVVSAVAELTPDKKDFIITYVVEEGKRYKFGDVTVKSELRDFDSKKLTATLPMHKGEWYNAKEVEDEIDTLNTIVGAKGYAFSDTRPSYHRDPKKLTMSVDFNVAQQPRVYVERIDVIGNTITEDKVIRREFRLAEGDAFNAEQIKRSTNRIKSLGYYQDKFEVKQKPGSAKDRVVLDASVEEKPTGELQLSAGYSSFESFIFQASIAQHNFRGRGQTLSLSGSVSLFQKGIDLSFVEPYLFDKNVSFTVDVYDRIFDNFNYVNTAYNLYTQSTVGFQARLGVALSEYVSLIGSYTLNNDVLTLNQSQFYDINSKGQYTCSNILAGYFLCDSEGRRTSSIVGTSLIYNGLNNGARPTKGQIATAGIDFSGLGGSVDYVRLRANTTRYFDFGHNFIFSLAGEGGLIKSLRPLNIAGEDDIYLNDRFFLGEPQISGFNIRGVGPRVIRKPLIQNSSGQYVPTTDWTQWIDTAIGGDYYYHGRAELVIPLGAGAKSLGIRPSIYADVGAVWGVTHPPVSGTSVNIFIPTRDNNGHAQFNQTNNNGTVTTVTNATNPLTGQANTPLGQSVAPFQEYFFGDTPFPRVALGIGINWNSPFGPFRIDLADAILHAAGDDLQTFTFNVGTQF